MGQNLVRFYQYKIKKSWKIAFYSTFIIGMLVHMYKFTNTLLNHDSLFNFYSDQNILGSGRWFLSIACQFSSYFDLPWLIGIFSVFLIALTAVVIVDIFRIENPVMLVLTGGLLVTFPAITQTFYFEFTADGYMMAMLLAALTVRFSLIGDNKIRHILIAIWCICLCCATYQAYVSFALVLAICYFIGELLENRCTNKEIGLWIRNQMIIYIIGLAIYYAVWKSLMLLFSCSPTTYMGIGKVGQVDIINIIYGIVNSIKSFVMVFLEWNILKYGMTAFSTFNILFLVFICVASIILVYLTGIYKIKLKFFLLLLSVMAIPFAAYIWYFASPGVAYNLRMEQCICILYIFTGVLFCRWARVSASNIMALLLSAIILNNSVNANIFYYHMDKANERSYATAVEMAMRVHILDDGNIKRVAFLGDIGSFDGSYYLLPQGTRQLGRLREIDRNLLRNESHIALYLSNILDFQLSYYQNHPEVPLPAFEKNEGDPVSSEWKLQFPLCDSATKKALMESGEVKQMGCWPASNSVQVIGDTIVIKLSEIEG